MKATLGEEFLDNGALVWDMKQEYRDNLKEIANSFWPNLTATHKDSILAQAFINSLIPDLNRGMLKKKPRSFEQARWGQ